MSSLAYKFKLPANSQVHPVFHVRHLQKHLLRDDNVLNQDALVDFIEPLVLPHKPEHIMDAHELWMQHHV